MRHSYGWSGAYDSRRARAATTTDGQVRVIADACVLPQLRMVMRATTTTARCAAVNTADTRCVRQHTRGYGWSGAYVSRNVLTVVIATVL
jgi:hypothetical protein